MGQAMVLPPGPISFGRRAGSALDALCQQAWLHVAPVVPLRSSSRLRARAPLSNDSPSLPRG